VRECGDSRIHCAISARLESYEALTILACSVAGVVGRAVQDGSPCILARDFASQTGIGNPTLFERERAIECAAKVTFLSDTYRRTKDENANGAQQCRKSGR
jgi:hypothetical protein